LFVLLAQAGSSFGADDGFKPIFDGKSLAGWEGDPKLWSIEDGTITGQTSADNPLKYNSFLIWRGGKPGDFELKAEFRMPNPGFANSGIQIRSWEGPKPWQVSGYQADMDGGNTYTGICYGEGFRGILCMRGQKVVIGTDHKPKVVEEFGKHDEMSKIVKKNDWNEYDIIAKGNHIIQKINGQVMSDITDEDTDARADGIIALQLHAGDPMKVQFRNIQLKETPKQPAANPADGAKKKLVFIAGKPSHGYGDHEYAADCMLWAKDLKAAFPNVETVVCPSGWPTDAKVFDGADAIVLYSDGGDSNPMLPHLEEIGKLMQKGVGFACLHYAVEVPKGQAGDCVKNWVGGYFETFWSITPPFWTAEFKQFPNHPVARGLKPFSLADEWYINMRFKDAMQGVTPILTAVPPDSIRREGNDAHGANEFVWSHKGQAEHLAWVCERADGGRGFGFTGGHSRWNMACTGYRTVLLNGIAWVAKLEVPADGVPSAKPTLAELDSNLSKK
jgi:hypothetical protein